MRRGPPRGPLRYHPPRPAGAHVVVAVDPGGKRRDGRACGMAVWLVPLAGRGGTLLGGGHVAAAAVPSLPGVLAHRHGLDPALPQAWVVEVPHLRGDRTAARRGVDALRATLADLRRWRPRGSTWRAVRPSGWKGNVPKAVHHRRILALLDEAEIDRLAVGTLDPEARGYQHDTADAVALGAWAAGRCGRGGVRAP